MKLRALALISLPLGMSMAHAQSSIFTQMDAASAQFKNAQADVHYDVYTRLVKDHDLSSGSVLIERQGSSQNYFAVVMSQGASTPDKILNYSGGTLQIYSPGTNQDDVFKAGDNKALYESYLTLGFGATGHDLQSRWTVKDQGPETIDGVKAEKLDLVGNASVQSMFTHVTLWVDPVRDVALKQIFYAPNGDYRTVTYSNIRMNEKTDKVRSKYAIKKGATRIAH